MSFARSTLTPDRSSVHSTHYRDGYSASLRRDWTGHSIAGAGAEDPLQASGRRAGHAPARTLGALVVGLTAALIVALPSVALAQNAPERLTFTGRLVRSDGQPESGDHQLRFVVYDQASGGQNLWEETQTVTVSNGYYTVELGKVALTPLSSVFTGPVRYLGISLDSESEMQPRISLLSAPYALHATNAVNAQHAVTADQAMNADNATNAANAMNAASATNAQHATTADQATNATNAMTAGSATTATNANNADTLDTLDSTAFALAGHTHPVATTTVAGFMSNTDKSKLNGLPSTFGNGLTQSGSTLSVSFAGSGGNFGTANTVARSDHTHPLPSLSCTQVTMTAAFNVGATAACGSSEVLTGGGCTDLPSGTGFNTTAAPSANTFTCKGTGGTVPTSNVTATAICCKLQ